MVYPNPPSIFYLMPSPSASSSTASQMSYITTNLRRLSLLLSPLSTPLLSTSATPPFLRHPLELPGRPPAMAHHVPPPPPPCAPPPHPLLRPLPSLNHGPMTTIVVVRVVLWPDGGGTFSMASMSLKCTQELNRAMGVLLLHLVAALDEGLRRCSVGAAQRWGCRGRGSSTAKGGGRRRRWREGEGHH